MSAIVMGCGAHDSRGRRTVTLHTDKAKRLWNATDPINRYWAIGKAIDDGTLTRFVDVTTLCTSVEACLRRRRQRGL